MNQDLAAIFRSLRPLFSEHADMCVVLSDEQSRYYLGTHQVREKDGYRTGFGGVEINKNYVSAHLMPIYVHPDMLETVSPQLKKRMQGKSCFNFKKADPQLFEELRDLVNAGISRFREDGKL